MVEVHDEPVALADLSGIIEATDKATLFRIAGPQGLEMVHPEYRRIAAESDAVSPVSTVFALAKSSLTASTPPAFKTSFRSPVSGRTRL